MFRLGRLSLESLGNDPVTRSGPALATVPSVVPHAARQLLHHIVDAGAAKAIQSVSRTVESTAGRQCHAGSHNSPCVGSSGGTASDIKA